MTTRVNRAEFLQQLEATEPGLSDREILEQSSCFIFTDGKVMTYNGEVHCSAPSNLPEEFTGAVRSQALLKIMRKLTEEEIEVDKTDSEFLIIGSNGRRSSGVRMDAEVGLPVRKIEVPESWKPLHEDFIDAVSLVHECCETKTESFNLTCIHIHPKWIEASSQTQMARFKLETGVDAPCLVKKESLKHIMSLGVTEFAETKNWIHFKGPGGQTISAIRYAEGFQYLDMSPHLKVKGEPVTLPKGMTKALDAAYAFSEENAENDQVMIEIRSGKIRVTGKGVQGWYKEWGNINYDGPNLAFMVSPTLLTNLVNRYSDCEITHNRIKVDGGNWRYVACLSKVLSKD